MSIYRQIIHRQTKRVAPILSKLVRLHLAVLIGLGFMLGPASSIQAAYPDEMETRYATHQSDDTALEVGAYWVSNYNQAGCPRSNNLPSTWPDASSLVDKLDETYFPFWPLRYPTPRWTNRFIYGSGDAWEEDWKRSSAGGKENSYIDTVDLAYFAGHGLPSGFFFGNCKHDDDMLSFRDAQGAWGDKDLDWVGLAACQVLADSNLGGWAGTLNGLRLILGFKTNMDDVNHGDYFGHYIRKNYSLSQAWFRAADRLQSQHVVARVLSAERAYFNDTYAHHRSSTTVDNDSYSWTHPVGSEPARAVNLAQITEMPAIEIAPLPLSEANALFEGVGQAFGVSTVGAAAVPSTLFAGSNVTETADGALEMDFGSGLYIYTDRGKLWTDDSEVRAASREAVRAISADEARGIADDFLNQNGLMRNDAQFYEVLADTVTEAIIEDSGDGVSASSTRRILQEDVMSYNVIYSRIITWTPTVQGASVAADPIEFSVIGPGAKMKVYVDDEVPAGVTAASLTNEAVLGGVGGYRDVSEPGVRAANSNAPSSVPVMAEATVETLFNTIEPMVALSYAPQPYASREIISKTLAYWEGPMGYPQNELIPVYALTVRSTLVDETESEYIVYIPVNAYYLPPFIQIESVEAPEILEQGSTIKLQAADASKTLAELGVDDSLDFVMGVGEYEYAWYLGDVSDENELKDGENGVVISEGGRVLEYTHNSDTEELLLNLVVTDEGKPAEPRTSQRTYSLNSATRSLSSDPANDVHLPIIIR